MSTKQERYLPEQVYLDTVISNLNNIDLKMLKIVIIKYNNKKRKFIKVNMKIN